CTLIVPGDDRLLGETGCVPPHDCPWGSPSRGTVSARGHQTVRPVLPYDLLVLPRAVPETPRASPSRAAGGGQTAPPHPRGHDTGQSTYTVGHTTPAPPPRWWGRGPMTQPLQLRERPGPTPRQLRLATGRQPSGDADEMGQAGWSCSRPGLVHPIAVTDQDAGPVVKQRRKGVCGPLGMHHVQGGGITAHHPQPLEPVYEQPGGFINVAHHGV